MNNLKTDSEIKQEFALILQAQKNPKYFEPLYNRYFKAIYLFIYKRTSDYDIAGDITSLVFLKALTNINRYVYKGVPFSAWLYRIASNEVNLYYRNTKKEKVVSIDESGLLNILSEIKIENDDEKQQKLFKALNSLKDNLNQIVQLRFFEEKSFKEIGDILGITENNAKVKLYRAIDKIRNLMK